MNTRIRKSRLPAAVLAAVVMLAASLVALVMLADVVWGAGEAAPAGETAAAAPAPAARSWRQLTDDGFRLLAADNETEALAAFEAALQLNPRGAAAKTGKGAVLARQGKLDEAEQVLRDALQLNPDPTRTHYELGRVYQQRGDYQRATEEFRKGIDKYREEHP